MNEVCDVFQLKVRFLGISPMIWRRVLVPADKDLCAGRLYFFFGDLKGHDFGPAGLAVGTLI